MTTYREFEAAMAQGACCEELIELRDRLPIQDKEAAAIQLRRKGCVDASSEHIYGPSDHEHKLAHQFHLSGPVDFRLTYCLCAEGPEHV